MSSINLSLAGRFLTVGVVNTLFGFSVIFGLMFFLELNPAASNLVGYACGFVLGYFLNKSWSFESYDTKNKGFLRYVTVMLIAYLSNVGSVYFGIIFLGINSYAAQIAGMFVYTSVSFLGCKLFVFRIKTYDE